MKQLQTEALVPSHEISHRDHLVPDNFHSELINFVLDVLINNHTATLSVLICLPLFPAPNNCYSNKTTTSKFNVDTAGRKPGSLSILN